MTAYLTREEVAARLHTTPRTVSELVRDFRVPVLRPGKVMLFDERAIRELEEACRSRSSVAMAPSTSTGPSPRLERKPDAAFAAALALTTSLLQRKKPARSKRASSAPHGTGNVLPFAGSPRRRKAT